jgi:hypothetical protein
MYVSLRSPLTPPAGVSSYSSNIHLVTQPGMHAVTGNIQQIIEEMPATSQNGGLSEATTSCTDSEADTVERLLQCPLTKVSA